MDKSGSVSTETGGSVSTETSGSVSTETGGSVSTEMSGSVSTETLNLYLNSNFYGFYALGLPQIEGLFAEAISIKHPNANLNDSLPIKVDKIRDSDEFFEAEFDYFNFYLPELRNKFMHTGIDSDIKFKCRNLLLDLNYLVKFYSSIEAPLMLVNKIIQEGELYFENIQRYSNYFEAIKSSESYDKFKDIEKVADKFITEVICEKVIKSSLFDDLRLDLLIAVKNLKMYLRLGSMYQTNPSLDLFTSSKKELVRHKSEISEIFSTTLDILVQDDIYIIKYSNDISKYLQIYLSQKNVYPSLLEQINQFRVDCEQLFSNASFLFDKINIEPPFDYFLAGKKYHHIK